MISMKYYITTKDIINSKDYQKWLELLIKHETIAEPNWKSLNIERYLLNQLEKEDYLQYDTNVTVASIRISFDSHLAFDDIDFSQYQPLTIKVLATQVLLLMLE